MSRWNAPNEQRPAWMLVLLDEPPACFDADGWALYLGGVRDEAMGDDSLRRRMHRGAVPRYCESCTAAHRAAMKAQGRCAPLPGFVEAAGV